MNLNLGEVKYKWTAFKIRKEKYAELVPPMKLNSTTPNTTTYTESILNRLRPLWIFYLLPFRAKKAFTTAVVLLVLFAMGF